MLYTDQAYLRTVQYATDGNLAARQSIYAFGDPVIDLPAAVLDSLRLEGTELVADIGCGNGAYLAELTRRGHRGRLVGVDASPGMLASARPKAPAAALVTGDAMTLPLRTGQAQVTLAMHMLYHMPDPQQVLRELRRITAGRVVIALNCGDHLAELRLLIRTVLAERGHEPGHAAAERLTLTDGAALAAGCFSSVDPHEVTSQLKVPGPDPVARYVTSMGLPISPAEHDAVAAEVTARADFTTTGVFTVTTHSGWLSCR